MNSNLEADLPKILAALRDKTTCVTEVVASQQFLSKKFDKMVQAMDVLKDEIKHLRAENDSLKRSLCQLSDNAKVLANAVNRAEVDIDIQHRAQLSSNAMILGIPRAPQEDIKTIALEVCRTVGFGDADNHIVSCSRVASSRAECPPIRMTFKTVRAKEKLIEHKTKFGKLDVSAIHGIQDSHGKVGKVVIRDDLSPMSMRILQELKGLQSQLNLRYVWPGRNGTIMVRRTDRSKPIAIQSHNEIKKLLANNLMN